MWSEPDLTVRWPIAAWIALAGLAACGDLTAPADPGCGNNFVEGTELCDGADLAGETCESLVGESGTLRCRGTCDAFDLSGCGAPASCGNETIELPERCDGRNVGETSCEDLGLGAGALACSANCLDYDVSSCGAPATCNNSQREGRETCDGDDLAGQTCQDLGFDGGTLACLANCNGFDTTGCQRNCERVTCDEAGAECGPVDDRCGGVLACGGCDEGLTCGGGGVANQCGGDCVQSCPPGWTCDTRGVCSGGDPTFTLNVDGVAIDVSLTLNGAPYALISTCDAASDDAGTMTFVRRDTGSSVAVPLPCNAATPVHASLSAGTYEIFVTGDGVDTELPALQTSLGEHTFNQDGAISLDVQGIVARISLTLNGAPYALIGDCDPASDDAGTMTFVERRTGASVAAELPCSAATPVAAHLPAGTYDIFVTGDGADTAIPAVTTSLGRHTFQQDTALTLNVDGVVISTKLTLNGSPYALISDCDSTTDDVGTITFVRRDSGAFVDFPLPCNASVAVRASLSAGVYDIFVAGDGVDTEIPAIRTNVGNRTFTSDSSLQLNIDGVVATVRLTLNGQPYSLIGECDSATDDAGTMNFVRQDNGAVASVPLPCNSGTPVRAGLSAGTYDIFVTGDGADTEIPALSTRIATHAFAGDEALTLNVDGVTIQATLTLNGAPYALISDCDPTSDDAGTMTFVRQDSGARVDVPLPCRATTPVQANLSAGTYTIFVAGDGTDTEIPALSTPVATRTFNASGADTFNVDGVTLEVHLTLNGQPYALISDCDPTSDDAGSMTFVRRDNGATASPELPCRAATPVRVSLSAGTYDIYVTGDAVDTEIPALRTLLARMRF